MSLPTASSAPDNKPVIHWFPVPPSVRRAVKQDGRLDIVALGVRLITTREDQIALDLSMSAKSTMVTYQRHRVIRSLAAVMYPTADTDKGGLSMEVTEGFDERKKLVEVPYSKLSASQAMTYLQQAGKARRATLSAGSDSLEDQPEEVYGKLHPKLAMLLSQAFDQVHNVDREENAYFLGGETTSL